MKKTEIYIRSSKNSYAATGTYDNGAVIVHAGSRINPTIAAHIKKENPALLLRKDPTIVDADGIVLKDCKFRTPSAAALFVRGAMSNGYTAWYVSKKNNLKKWLADQDI